MYCKLKKDFMMRGWKLLPTGVVNRNTGGYMFLKAREYETIRFCNGMFDESSVVFSAQDRQIMDKFTEFGLLEKNAEASSLAPEQEYREYPNRFLHEVHWLLTGRCNARCKHCYMSAPHAAMGELPHETCLAIIEQLAECGIQCVTLSGGEPLIRKDFWEIVDALLANGIHISSIMSNGLLVNEDVLDKLDERGIKPHFSMSFDGTDGWHDWLRGVKGAAESVLHAFGICSERGFRTTCEYCLHSGNAHTLRDSVKLLDSLGVQSLKVNRLEVLGEGEAIRRYALTAPEAYGIFLRYIPDYFADNLAMKINLGGFFLSDKDNICHSGYCKLSEGKSNHCLCGHIRNTMLIDADGRILPCIPVSSATALHKYFPLITDVRLQDILTDSSYLNFSAATLGEYLSHNPTCAKCEYRNLCAGGCRGRAAMENHDDSFWGVDREACEFFHGGYYKELMDLLTALDKKFLTIEDGKRLTA